MPGSRNMVWCNSNKADLWGSFLFTFFVDDFLFLFLTGREFNDWGDSSRVWRKPRRTHGQNEKHVEKQILSTTFMSLDGHWILRRPDFLFFFFLPPLKFTFTFLMKQNCYRGRKNTDLHCLYSVFLSCLY